MRGFSSDNKKTFIRGGTYLAVEYFRRTVPFSNHPPPHALDLNPLSKCGVSRRG